MVHCVLVGDEREPHKRLSTLSFGSCSLLLTVAIKAIVLSNFSRWNYGLASVLHPPGSPWREQSPSHQISSPKYWALRDRWVDLIITTGGEKGPAGMRRGHGLSRLTFKWNTRYLNEVNIRDVPWEFILHYFFLSPFFFASWRSLYVAQDDPGLTILLILFIFYYVFIRNVSHYS